MAGALVFDSTSTFGFGFDFAFALADADADTAFDFVLVFEDEDEASDFGAEVRGFFSGRDDEEDDDGDDEAVCLSSSESVSDVAISIGAAAEPAPLRSHVCCERDEWVEWATNGATV